jgi:AraC-like DNA-binding protein
MAVGVSSATVSAGFARGLFELALRKGAPRDALLAQAGLSAPELEQMEARLPFDAYVALMRAAKALTGDPALALHYGEQVNIAEVSIAGLVGQASPTLLESWAQLNRFVPLVVETENAGGGERFPVVRDRHGLWLTDARLHPNAFPELTESALAQLACGPRRYGAPPFVRAVRVTHADPGYAGEYERIFQAPVTFGADRNGLLLDEAVVTRRFKVLPPYAAEVLAGHADSLLARLDGARSTRGQVEAILAPLLDRGEPRMEAVAAQLGVSRQTLFRRLKSEGATFEAVLDDLRLKLALRHLCEGGLSVNATAFRLGFSDPAAFSRAFKRWTGKSPSQARELAPE